VLRNFFVRIRLFSKVRKEPYLLFYNVLGFYPDHLSYYQLAVRHRSVAITRQDGSTLSNERLEFLGDAVLNSVVTDILYHRYENQREGFLTNTRSKIVKRESLNQLAIEIGLDKLILSTKYVNAHTNNNIYGNAFEALIGAIYLDYGYKQCKNFVERRLFRTFIDLDKVAEDEANFKSKLIEWCQKYYVVPEFVLADDALDTTNKHIFTTQLFVNGVFVCEATGLSKKESHQKASRLAFQQFEKQPDLVKQILQPQ